MVRKEDPKHKDINILWGKVKAFIPKAHDPYPKPL